VAATALAACRWSAGDDGHVRLHPHHGHVLERVVADAVAAVLQAAADPDHPDRQAVLRGTVADELVRPQRREGRDRVREGHVASLGQARRDPDHVLLRHTHVEEAVREALGEGLQRHEAEVGGQEADARVGSRELDQAAD
jgi:hypothetical protein